MKKLVAVSIIFLFGGTAIAQDEQASEVPQSVIESFNCLYPKITDVSWYVDDVNYVASFRLDGKAVSLVFDEYANVVKVKNEIKLYELPLDVNHLISREYSDWRIAKASHIDSNGTAYYEAEVQKEQQTMVLVFNRHGGLLVKVIL
jgi:hypothetical protein